MRAHHRLLIVPTVALVFAGTLLSAGPARAAVTQCGTSAGYAVCLEVSGPTLSGEETVTVTVGGSTTGIWELRFAWGPTPDTTAHLYSDYEAPYTFVWPTDEYLDADGYVNLRVKRSASTSGEPVALPVSLENGNEGSVPRNPTDWDQLFTPRPSIGDPVVAAVGDGAYATLRSDEVAASVAASEASALLYLGDVYYRGTAAEMLGNYGRASFDGSGPAAGWGALAGWTKPTLGNHEAFNVETWRDYWHGRPNWETFTLGGVRFVDLNSECSVVGGCGTTSAQYQWAESVLQSSTEECVVAFWHRPVLSAGQDAASMNPLWALLARYGGDVVLNGHQHHMAAYAPLDGSLQAGRAESHMVQLISGSGGHEAAGRSDTDSRVSWQRNSVRGALYLTLAGGEGGTPERIDWEFRDTQGSVVTSSGGAPGRGSVACTGETGDALFSDDFSGGLGNWSPSANLTLDTSSGAAAPPSARVAVSGAAGYGTHVLAAAYPSLCARAAFDVSSIGSGSVALLKLRTATGTSVGRVFVDSARTLRLRGDLSGQTVSTGVVLPSGWHALELCGTTGAAGRWDLGLDGTPIGGLTTNNGTTGFGRVQVLDDSPKTFTARVDDVVVDA